jgi:hypothetical protein
MFDSATTYNINFYNSNNGSEQGVITHRMGRMYVAKPDDRLAQKLVLENFEKDWKADIPTSGGGLVLPGAPGLWTEPQSISQEDENNLKFNRYTVYFVRRIEYTDKAGKWWSDRCEHYQIRETKMDINLLHPCLVLMNGRYRAKRQ